MISLTSAQMCRLLVFLDQILVIESFSEMSTILLPALAGLMGATLVKYHYVYRLNEPFSIDIGWPAELFTLSNMAAYARVAHLHPLPRSVDKVMATAPEYPLAVSDVVSIRTWRSSQVYREAMRAVGGEDQMAMILGVSRDAVGLVTLTRCGGTFTDADHQLLFRARRHIAAAARRALRTRASGAAMQTRPIARWINLDEVIPEPAPGGLSVRELEVLGLLSEGLTSGQIGRRLGISPRTVDKHVEHIYRKVGAGSRAAATNFLLARERGGRQLGGSADVRRHWFDQARLILSEGPE
jgi:DNA-binding CsgD family transcriptional regulator